MRRAWLMLVWLVLLAAATDHASGPPTGTGMRYVYLIRHGWYTRERDRDERVGNGLDSLGRQQARLIAVRLASLPVRIDTLVSSDYSRALQTADIIGGVLHRTPAVDSMIHECSPTSDRIDLRRRRPHDDFDRCDTRLKVAWERYMRPAQGRDSHDVLVCHGNVIRWFVARALGLDPRHWSAMDIGNASLTVIAVRPDGTTRLALYSDVGHLPVALQTWTGHGAGWSTPGGPTPVRELARTAPGADSGTP